MGPSQIKTSCWELYLHKFSLMGYIALSFLKASDSCVFLAAEAAGAGGAS